MFAHQAKIEIILCQYFFFTPLSLKALRVALVELVAYQLVVKKRQTILNESLDNKVLGLFGLGMSYEDIRNHMQEMYGTEVSDGLLSKITDKLLPIITEWRNRPLESIYTVVFLDAMFFKARENGKVVTKTIYNILGINQQGHLMPDHVHMCIEIPPKHAVSSIVGYIKGKSAIMIARSYLQKERNFVGEHFWARGYAVSTVGYELEAIKKYIREQQTNDESGR